jgi:hypothetical protein
MMGHETHRHRRTRKRQNRKEHQQQQQKSDWEVGPVEKQRDRHTDRGWTLPPSAELADCIIRVASKVNLSCDICRTTHIQQDFFLVKN